MIELMLDIESLSTCVDAHILQVAVVPFDLDQSIIGTNVFNMCVNAGGQDDRRIDMSTVKWWMEQTEEAQAVVFSPRKSFPLGTVLSELYRYVKGFNEDTRLWCKGPEFDTAILKHAFEQVGMSTPWRHSYVRDVRTACEVSRAEMCRGDRYGPTHDAVDDCKEQIKDIGWHLYNLEGFAREQLA